MTETRTSRRQHVMAHVARVVGRLQSEYLPTRSRARGTSWGAAAMARLRRGDAADPSAVPDVWEITIPGAPDEILGDGDTSRAEQAFHAALVLYSRHQQGRGAPMHEQGQSLGAATRRLARRRGEGGELDSGVIRRFHTVATASSHGARVRALNALVSLLRAESIPLDYPRLAGDLYALQSADPHRVLMRWGRDLHRHAGTTGDGVADKGSATADTSQSAATTEREAIQ